MGYAWSTPSYFKQEILTTTKTHPRINQYLQSTPCHTRSHQNGTCTSSTFTIPRLKTLPAAFSHPKTYLLVPLSHSHLHLISQPLNSLYAALWLSIQDRKIMQMMRWEMCFCFICPAGKVRSFMHHLWSHHTWNGMQACLFFCFKPQMMRFSGSLVCVRLLGLATRDKDRGDIVIIMWVDVCELIKIIVLVIFEWL